LLVLFPGDVEEIRIGETDLETVRPELVDEIDNAVLEIERGETENEGRDRVDKIVRISRKLGSRINARMDLGEDLIVGAEAGVVAGDSFFKEIAGL